MADSTGRSEAFGQIVIKVGVPLAVAALAGYFYGKKSSTIQPVDDDDDDHGAHEESTDKKIDEIDEARNKVFLGLVDQIKEIQVKEEEVEARFERYQCMKEYEGMVLELNNTLQLEMVRGDYLEKEVSWVESEARRMQEFEIYGLNLFGQVKNMKQENRRLKKKVKQYLRRNNEGIRLIGAQKLRIQEFETLIMRSRSEIEKGTNVVNKLDEEICEFKGLLDELRREKLELSVKLEEAETSLTLKHENEITAMDEYKHIINELEKLQNDYSAEASELAMLRWTNAFLRRQLMKRDGREMGFGRLDNDLDHEAEERGGENTLLEVDLHQELEKIEMEREKLIPEVKTGKRSVPKILKKLVTGIPKHHSKSKVGAIKANKVGDVKSYGRHFSSDWVEEHVHGRSFSSA